MSTIDKLLEKFTTRPYRTDIKFDEAEKLLLHFGFVKTHGKGSHTKFSHDKLDYHLSIPADGNLIKNIYVKHINEALIIIEAI